MTYWRAQWLFPIAVALHNGEEAVAMPRWLSARSWHLPHHLMIESAPNRERIWIGLLLLTAAAFVITAMSARRGRQTVWAYLLFGFMATMLANVFVPHLPATLYFARYTPGIVTAMAINLPLMAFLMRQALAEQWVSGHRAIAYGVLVPVGTAATIIALFALPSR